MSLDDAAIAACIFEALEAAAARGEAVIVNNDGDFVRSLNLDASITSRARVYGSMVKFGMICRSRPWPEAVFDERPVTIWLARQPTPPNVLAYRR